LKPKKQDRNLRELFQHTLENVEVRPDPSFDARLMRKLALREFLHFNPLRFNIYYLGGIVAAGIVTILLLTPAPERHEPAQPIQIQSQEPLSDIRKKNTGSEEISSLDKTKADDAGAAVPVIKNNAAPAEAEKTAEAKAPVERKALRGNYELSPDTFNRSLKGKELFPLSSEDNLKLHEVQKAAGLLFEPSVDRGCAPLKVIFTPGLSGYDSCLWTFGDGGSSAGNNPEWIYDVEGEYKVVLKVYGPDGAISFSSALISVFPRPSAGFEILPEKASIPDDEIRFQNYSAGAVRYLWSFGDGSTSDQFEPLYRYEKPGNYNVSLKVYSENGCADSLTVYNAFSGSACFIEFPNAFIPNAGGPSGGVYSSKSDEYAQVFHPSYSGVSEYHLKIFSKIGILIFESNDINIGWDGYYKGQLSNYGVYIWKVRGNFTNGVPFTKMGDLTLLKN
jgi:PKD repeat protein